MCAIFILIFPHLMCEEHLLTIAFFVLTHSRMCLQSASKPFQAAGCLGDAAVISQGSVASGLGPQSHSLWSEVTDCHLLKDGFDF